MSLGTVADLQVWEQWRMRGPQNRLTSMAALLNLDEMLNT